MACCAFITGVLERVLDDLDVKRYQFVVTSSGNGQRARLATTEIYVLEMDAAPIADRKPIIVAETTQFLICVVPIWCCAEMGFLVRFSPCSELRCCMASLYLIYLFIACHVCAVDISDML